MFLQKLKSQTHPFTFLSLSPFRSCEAVETTVSLHRKRKFVSLCIWTQRFGHKVVQHTPWGRLIPLFRGSLGLQRVRFLPGKHREHACRRHISKKLTDLKNQWYDGCSSTYMSHTCSPFLPGRPDRPWIPASPWAPTVEIHIMFMCLPQKTLLIHV